MNMEENMARFQINCLIVFVAMAVIPVEMPQKMPSAERFPAVPAQPVSDILLVPRLGSKHEML